MLIRSLFGAAALAAGAMSAALAADKPVAFEPTPASGWIVTVRANALTGPKWDGADQNGIMAFPTMSFRRAGTVQKWRSPDDGISFSVVDQAGFEMGPVARIRGGRYYDGNRELFGIHDVKWTVEPGVFANIWLAPTIRARAEVRHGFRGEDGFHANFGLDWVNTFDRWTFAIGPRVELADGKFMRTNFGVTPLDALWNRQVLAYRPDGGFKSLGVYSSLGYQISDAWNATLHGGYNRLSGDAADSPIVKRFGSANQFTLGLQLAYSFPVSGF